MTDALYQTDLEWQTRHGIIAGIDEAGRGPLAGPVVVAAVVLDYDRQLPGLDDSKQLSSAQRDRLYDQIVQSARTYCIAIVDTDRIDRLNILGATLEGMREAARGLNQIPRLALIDGNQCPSGLPCRATAVIKGDGRHACIAAASILAKVTRDRIMCDLHQHYPQYGFDRHKGYPTADHLRALRQFGVCAVHRRSFRPVCDLLSPQDDE